MPPMQTAVDVVYFTLLIPTLSYFALVTRKRREKKPLYVVAATVEDVDDDAFNGIPVRISLFRCACLLVTFYSVWLSQSSSFSYFGSRKPQSYISVNLSENSSQAAARAALPSPAAYATFSCLPITTCLLSVVSLVVVVVVDVIVVVVCAFLCCLLDVLTNRRHGKLALRSDYSQ